MTEHITKGQSLYIASYAANTGNIEKARKLLDVAPTADVVEVVHGAWLQDDEFKDLFWICSCCGFMSTLNRTGEIFNYCPHCGARMDLEPPEREEE